MHNLQTSTGISEGAERPASVVDLWIARLRMRIEGLLEIRATEEEMRTHTRQYEEWGGILRNNARRAFTKYVGEYVTIPHHA